MRQKNELGKAKEFLNAAREYEDYFFEDMLTDSIKTEMKKID